MKLIAVGNPLYGDDGVGAAVLERARATDAFPGAELIDAGTDALSLIDRFADEELHVIVDAARMGLEPGRVVRFAPGEVALGLAGDRLSLHGFGLAEAFALAERIDRLPRRLVIVGVEPQTLEIDRGLSDAVASAVPEVLEIIKAEVHSDEADHPGH
ncbi:MAG: hydrogenase maturation protease [bacterium]|nr:hydrogenase maturation protease [bacterium]